MSKALGYIFQIAIKAKKGEISKDSAIELIVKKINELLTSS